MRAVLSTFGTAGDIIPFARLARALLARGHAVTVCTWEHYRDWFPPEAAFRPAGGGVDDAEVDRTLEMALRAPTRFHQAQRFARLFYGLGDGDARARAYYARAREDLAGHDLALINILDHVAQAAADSLGLPWACYASRPPPAPELADPFFADVDADVAELMGAVTGVRRRVRVWRELSRVLTLAACSPRLADAHREPSVRLTGAWLDPPRPEPLPAAVERFLARGPALLVTFGTMPDVTGRTPALLAAAARSGWRAIFQVLPPAPAPAAASDDVFVLRERVPFAALLPRVAAVVHHGSVGTTHEVLRAGRPSFVVPHMGDQYFWGHILHKRGLSPPPVPFTALEVGVLAARLAALHDPALATRVADLAPVIAAEDGVAVAAQLFEAAGRA